MKSEHPPLPDWRPGEDWRAGLERLVNGLEWLPETSMRARLASMGLQAGEIDDVFNHARNMGAAAKDASWEHVTAIGYRNAYGQEVVRKTARGGTSPEQRVFAVRCGHCRSHYGANGCDLDSVRCPACQGGPPSLPLDDPH